MSRPKRGPKLGGHKSRKPGVSANCRSGNHSNCFSVLCDCACEHGEKAK